MEDVTTRAVGPDQLSEVAALFVSERNTRHCWCMAPCASRAQFAVGWVGGGNRRRFEARAAADPAPMGVLARAGDAAVGWCACGPRARYAGGGSPWRVPAGGAEEQHGTTWVTPCLVVRADHRGRGLTALLVRAAVDLAQQHGALAVEACPVPRSAGRSAEAFRGRQQVFEDLGFRCVDDPAPDRVLVRLDLPHP